MTNPVERLAHFIGGALEMVVACLPEQAIRAACDRDYRRSPLDDPDDGGEALEPRWAYRDRVSAILQAHGPLIADFPDYQGWCDHVAGIIAATDKVTL